MEPAVKPAAATTASGAVGVLATATTAHGESLARLVDRFGKGVDVHVAVPEGLVELIERGEGDGPGAEAILRPILERWRAAAVDVVVLGCTHYPFVRAAIERIAGPAVAVIDPAPAVARQAARVLATVSLGPSPSGLASVPGQTHLLTTGDPASLRAAVARLLSAPWTRTASYTHLEA
jgi:glutamate racemase